MSRDRSNSLSVPEPVGVDPLLHRKYQVAINVPAIVPGVVRIVVSKVPLPLAHDAVAARDGVVSDVVHHVVPHGHVAPLKDVDALLPEVVNDVVLDEHMGAVDLDALAAAVDVLLPVGTHPPGGSQDLPVVVHVGLPVHLEASDRDALGPGRDVEAGVDARDGDALPREARDDDVVLRGALSDNRSRHVVRVILADVMTAAPDVYCLPW